MIPELDGVYFASNPEAFALDSVFNIKTDFLGKARKMAAPEIAELIIRFNGTLGAAGGDASGVDYYKLVKKLILTDDDEFVNVSGASIRVLEQMDFGSKQVDGADVASGASSATFQTTIRFTFEPPRMQRPRDFRVPLINLLDGGQIQIQTPAALPTNFTTSSTLSMRVWCRVVDGRVKELKSRRKVAEQSFNRDDDTYPVDGAIRALILSSVLTTTGYTALTGITVLNSNNLEVFPDFPRLLAVDRYRRMADSLGSLDQFVAGTAIPLITPDRGQMIGKMPIVRAAHLRMGSTPTSAIVLRDVVVARPPNISALHMGYPDVQSYQLGILRGGRVVDEKNTHVKNTPAELARIMPVRIKGD